MPSILVPSRMPGDLQTRDSSKTQPIQTAQPVTALASLGRVEQSIAHLAAARPLGCPATAHKLALDTSAVTVYLRIGAPIAPLMAQVTGLLTATGEDTVDVSIVTTTEATPVTLEVPVHYAITNDPIRFDVEVQIGNGAVEAANLNHETIEVTINKNSALVDVYLESAIVCPLPIEGSVTST